MDILNQIELEKLYNKNQGMKRLRFEFRIPEIVDHCAQHNLPIDFVVDLLAQLVLHRRASAGVLTGILGPKHFGETVPELQQCADTLVKASECGLADWDEFSQQFIIRLDVTQNIYEELERYQYPLPMIVEPRELQTNYDVGFFTSKGSIILKNNHHDDDVCLDHLNRLNRVKLKLNPDTARMVQNQWRNLDKQKDGETPEKFKKRVRAFEKYDRSSRDVMEHLFIAGNEFYLTHRYDKRGRTYAQGYHVNPQGNDWNKAVIEFHDEEVVNDR